MTRIRLVLIVVVAVCLAGGAARTQEPAAPQKPTLYLVSNSHLDTQWNWTVQDTIREFVPPTFFDNFKLFERFPYYIFNYEGAIHYMWFKEYYPADWPHAAEVRGRRPLAPRRVVGQRGGHARARRPSR